jgi:hypothetical protein
MARSRPISGGLQRYYCKPFEMKAALLSLSLLILFTHCHNSTSEKPSEAMLVGLWQNTSGPNTLEFDQDNNLTVGFSGEAGWTLKYSLEASEEQNQLILYDSAVTYEYDYSFLADDKLRLDLRQVNTPSGTNSPLSSATFQRVE